jgi:hypothetical protein
VKINKEQEHKNKTLCVGNEIKCRDGIDLENGRLDGQVNSMQQSPFLWN